jgi:tRNA splicing endonuclease
MDIVMHSEIRQALAARETQDTKIAQKVMQAHREAFRERFPGQVEHSLRLTAERLQAMLTKPEGFDMHRRETWPADSEEIRNMAMALESLYTVYREVA